MYKILSADLEKCTGCRTCELVCSMKHHDEYNPQKSRIRVYNFVEQGYFVPVVCLHCNEAYCEKVCPAGAITVNYDEKKGVRAVQISKEKCVGCKMCIFACPFGNVRFIEDGYSDKCDLCGGDPECVKSCAKEALKFKEVSASYMQKVKSTAEKILAAYQQN